jgi:hypothetical protein
MIFRSPALGGAGGAGAALVVGVGSWAWIVPTAIKAMNASKQKHKQRFSSKYLMETPPVEERDATIARRAQLRPSTWKKLNSQQTNATGQSNWQANWCDFSKRR